MGGNVFENTSPIKEYNIRLTLLKFKEELHRLYPNSEFNFEFLGSAGKKPISNDIDLAYDISNFFEKDTPFIETLKKWYISEKDYNNEYDIIRKRCKTATTRQSMLRSILNNISNNINEKSKILFTSSKGTVNGSLYCVFPQFNESGRQLEQTVQIDILVGDLDWLRFSYHSESYSGNIKGLHRTQLLIAMFENKGRSFKHDIGIINKKSRNIEANTPKKAVKLLNKLYKFNGIDISLEILQNYYKTYNFLIMFLPPKEFNKIFDIYLKILDSTRADIPKNLQYYWKQNKTRLNLTGKFLPNNSELCQAAAVEHVLVEIK